MLKQAKEVMRIEADAILALAERINGDFSKAVEMMRACEGRVVVTGMGKSGIIGRKLSATLASTGTPSFFLHPAEGIHGDLGMVTGHDVVLALSNSGETAEVLGILPSLRRIGAAIIALSGAPQSTLEPKSSPMAASTSMHRCAVARSPVLAARPRHASSPRASKLNSSRSPASIAPSRRGFLASWQGSLCRSSSRAARMTLRAVS